MLDEKSAPSLVLGARTDCSREELGVAFARATRRLKEASGALFTLEQLTAALSELENTERSREFRLTYRVPANPAVVDPEAQAVGSWGRIGVDDDHVEIPTDGLEIKQQADVARVLLARATSRLLTWQWAASAEASRMCLRFADREDVRDEALNVLAAALAMQGDGRRAMDALSKALEGEWNLALQGNAALIAVSENPTLAVEYMARLVDGGASARDRVHAVRFAIALWRKTQGEQTGSEDEEEFAPLPASLLKSIYELLDSSALSEEDFYDLGSFLARVEPKALHGSGALTRSAHHGSPSYRLVIARSKSFSDFTTALMESHQWEGLADRPWITEQVDELVQTATHFLLSDEVASKKTGVGMGFKFLSGGLPVTSSRRAVMTALTIMGLPSIWGNERQQPSDDFARWLEHAQALARDRSIEMSEAERNMTTEITSDAGDLLGALLLRALLHEGSIVEKQAGAIVQRTTGFLNRLSVNMSAVREAASPLIEWCDSANASLLLVRRVVTKSEIHEEMDRLRRDILKVQTVLKQRSGT